MIEPESPYFAAVDLGSNSFHMVICRVNKDTVEIVDRVRDMIQIASGMKNGNLAEDAQIRALECLSRFADRLRGIPASQVRAVGTKSLRSAKDASKFIAAAERALGHPIAIISGFEEARLVYKGLAHTVSGDHTQRLVIDIGGASTEFIIGKDEDPILLESLNFGCVAYSERYDLRSNITGAKMHRAYLAACADIEQIRRAYSRKGWDQVYGTSGTMRAIADLLMAKDGGAMIKAESLRALAADVIENSEKTLESLPKLRREVLPAGIAILRAIFDELKLEKIHIADSSLKEGLIYDTIGRLNAADARYAAVSKLQSQYHIDEDQGIRVAATAHYFWQSLNTPPLPGVSRTKILTWAAQLHEVGLGISHADYHHHGYYILRHSDLAGFGRYEQLILACLVRAHRKKLSFDRFEGLDKTARNALLPMVLCLRLAVILHRHREDLDERPVLTHASDSGYVLSISENWLKNSPLIQAGIEKELDHLACVGIKLVIKSVSNQ
jgi:exopolyphosphatase / guanosine-5'-triphosphate,3'-diphosphate pyrophosphatase